MDIRPIGIFDSGIGGLTVLKELQKKLPQENFIYFGDTLNFPYGEKTKEEIIDFSRNNVNYLIKKNVKLIIIACGTATSQSLKVLQKEFEIPIIGIIEPTVEYVKNLKLNKIGVIATTGTIRSGAWAKNLKKAIPEIEITNKACPLLANIAEEGKAKSKESLEAVHKYMSIFKRKKINTIILGCTHYPIYDEIIKKEFLYQVNLINTGVPLAKYIKDFLLKKDMENIGGENKTQIILSKNEMEFEKNANIILKSVKPLDITKLY